MSVETSSQQSSTMSPGPQVYCDQGYSQILYLFFRDTSYRDVNLPTSLLDDVSPSTATCLSFSLSNQPPFCDAPSL